jgi:hypothetical protein
MAGQIKRMINSIIQKRAKGNPVILETTTCKLILKGLDPALFNERSPDDPTIIVKVLAIAAELGVSV